MLLAWTVAPIVGKLMVGLWAAMMAVGVGAAAGVFPSDGNLGPSQYHEIAAP